MFVFTYTHRFISEHACSGCIYEYKNIYMFVKLSVFGSCENCEVRRLMSLSLLGGKRQKCKRSRVFQIGRKRSDPRGIK